MPAEACIVCGFAGDGGPSDHEPWCPAFMRGTIGLDQLDVYDVLADVARERAAAAIEEDASSRG